MLTTLSRTRTINITEDMQSPIFRIAIYKYGVSMTNSWTLTFGPLTIFGCIINNIQKSKWTLSDIMLIIKLNIKISDICWKKKKLIIFRYINKKILMHIIIFSSNVTLEASYILHNIYSNFTSNFNYPLTKLLTEESLFVQAVVYWLMK